MVRVCSVKTCGYKSNATDSEPKITIFAVPKDENLRTQWENNLGQKLFKYSCVCEQHFEEKDINKYFETKIFDGLVERIPRDRILLKKDAKPFKVYSGIETQDHSYGKKHTENTNETALVNNVQDSFNTFHNMEVDTANDKEDFKAAIKILSGSTANILNTALNEQAENKRLSQENIVRNNNFSSYKDHSYGKTQSTKRCTKDIEKNSEISKNNYETTNKSEAKGNKDIQSALNILVLENTEEKGLNSIVKNLKRQLNRKSEKCKKLKTELQEMENQLKNVEKTAIDNQISTLPETQQEVIKTCFMSIKVSPKQQRFSPKWLLECILLRLKNKDCYEHLKNREILPLPSIKTVDKYIQQIALDCDIDFEDEEKVLYQLRNMSSK